MTAKANETDASSGHPIETWNAASDAAYIVGLAMASGATVKRVTGGKPAGKHLADK